jgi:hypothetical protein
MENFSLDRLDFISFFFFCFILLFLFFIWRQYFLSSRKCQAWMIMLLSSFILTLTGFTYAISAEINPSHWSIEYIYGDDRFSRTILIFFTACNVMDLLIGMVYYQEFLYPLTTIFHHLFFITIVTVFLGTHSTRGFLITFVFELPTFLLSVGTVWPHLRNDMAFGITFFLTRICFHILAIWRLAQLGWDGIGWKVLCLPFLMHVNWFYNWVTSYCFGGKKKNSKNNENEKKES